MTIDELKRNVKKDPENVILWNQLLVELARANLQEDYLHVLFEATKHGLIPNIFDCPDENVKLFQWKFNQYYRKNYEPGNISIQDIRNDARNLNLKTTGVKHLLVGRIRRFYRTKRIDSIWNWKSGFTSSVSLCLNSNFKEKTYQLHWYGFLYIDGETFKVQTDSEFVSLVKLSSKIKTKFVTEALWKK